MANLSRQLASRGPYFHCWPRCLVVVDVKFKAFTAADASEMNVCPSHARENWIQLGQNPQSG